jgi:hypothetical protein
MPVHLNAICENFGVYLVIVLSFQYVGLPTFGQLSHVCVLCRMYVVRYLEFCRFVLMAWICSVYWTLKAYPVCPVHLSAHFLHCNG